MIALTNMRIHYQMTCSRKRTIPNKITTSTKTLPNSTATARAAVTNLDKVNHWQRRDAEEESTARTRHWTARCWTTIQSRRSIANPEIRMIHTWTRNRRVWRRLSCRRYWPTPTAARPCSGVMEAAEMPSLKMVTSVKRRRRPKVFTTTTLVQISASLVAETTTSWPRARYSSSPRLPSSTWTPQSTSQVSKRIQMSTRNRWTSISRTRRGVSKTWRRRMISW